MNGLEQVVTGTTQHEAQIRPLRACIAVEGVPTPDGRLIAPYAINWPIGVAVSLRKAGSLIGYVKVTSANTDGSGEVWASLFVEPDTLSGTVGLGVDLVIGETDYADGTTLGGRLVGVSVIPVDKVCWPQCVRTIDEGGNA